MSRKKRKTGKDIHGILLFDKPYLLSSNKALQQVKRVFNANKAGHTGSLDPLATGCLALCFGEATKVSAYLLDANKTYHVSMSLGSMTTTGDVEGEVISNKPIPLLDDEVINQLFKQFEGESQQIPPMYSALKVDGQRLYKLARQGVEVERKPRSINIFNLHLIEFNEQEITFIVECSKGTYVRTLVEDMGDKLGCGAFVKHLRRTSLGPFVDEKLYSFDDLNSTKDTNLMLSSLLLPIDSVLLHLPRVNLNDTSTYYLKQGQAVTASNLPDDGLLRLYDEKNNFIGIGSVTVDGQVTPKKLMNYSD